MFDWFGEDGRDEGGLYRKAVGMIAFTSEGNKGWRWNVVQRFKKERRTDERELDTGKVIK